MKKSNFAKAVATVSRLSQFVALSESKQKQVIAALNRGRVYLSDRVNGSPAVYNLHYTLEHTGKMKNVISISSSVLSNPICCARRKDTESICAHCFAAAQMGMYKNMDPVFTANLELLKTHLLCPSEIPVILSRSGLLRVESFGDVCNVLQAANYLRIAEYNPWQSCAIWTKNPEFYHAAIQAGLAHKAKNVNIIYSSRKVNEAAEIPAKYAYFIDKVFTVYDETGAESVNINCGARSCATCRRCYSKNTAVNVNEKLK